MDRQIILVYSATIFEEHTLDRGLRWFQLIDKFFSTASSIRFYVKKRDFQKIARMFYVRFFRLWYCVELIRLPYFYLFSKDLFKHKKYKILDRVFCAAGIVYGLLFFPPLYKKNTGY